MSRVYFILYCEFTGSYAYQERADCWEYTNVDCATEFESEEEARKAKKRLEAEGFPPLTIFKMKQTTEIVDVIQ